ncbi:Substrate-specific component PdxU2 of predicted pyridoxin-related ECF transporter [Lachnospiraceae bacterium TWA4]|nr:Substrate-specific component PdxU2 of predicted pyridoxin-related ECF transporter [Lachnospiraceae bacterium TWA4]
MMKTQTTMPTTTSLTSTKRLVVTSLLMAMTIVLSSIAVPVPGGHLYLCDITICLAALLLNPFEAFVACGIGSFLGDMIFYPLPMFVSLTVHGIQGIVISLIAHHTFKKNPKLAGILAVSVGAVIMVVGYTLGKIYVYSTFEYAMAKLPYQIIQALVGAILGVILCFHCGIKKAFHSMVEN